MDIANAIDAYNQLTPWHLLGFVAIAVMLARPDWLALVWNRFGGRGRVKPAANGWATKADIADINKRLDNHEDACDRRNAEDSKREDALRNDVSTIKSDVSNLKGNMLVMQTDIKWIGKSIGRRHNEEFPDD